MTLAVGGVESVPDRVRRILEGQREMGADVHGHLGATIVPKAEQREDTGLIAPSHALRHKINAIVRERLICEGQGKGPELETVRLMSRGYTRAQKSVADNYTAGSVVGFPHLATQKTLYVEISRARERAELVTGNKDKLRERLVVATGEWIVALEAVGPSGGQSVAPDEDTEREQEKVADPIVSEGSTRATEQEKSCKSPGLEL